MLIIDMRHPYSIENSLGKNYRPSGRVFCALANNFRLQSPL